MKRLVYLIASVLVLAALTVGCCVKPRSPGRVSLDLGAGVMLNLVRLEPGEFTMGSDTDEQRPPHRVFISRPFYMGTTEVTNAQYRRYRSKFDSNDRRGGANIPFQKYIRSLRPEFNGDEQPVVYVGWEEAQAFTKWLSEKSGKTVRLPTEAEWEYACRAGTTSKYSWGDEARLAHLYANTNDPVTAEKFKLGGPFPNDDGFRATAPVGSFRPNAFGLYDMHGNVVEWTADFWHESYTGAPIDGSAWVELEEGGQRVTKGGSFECSVTGTHYFSCTSAGRSWNYLGNHNFGTGFRVVVEDTQTDQSDDGENLN